MAGAHAAAQGDVVAEDAALAIGDADEAQVVGEHVHIVGRRQREADLELARQVALAVDRLDFLAGTGHLLLVQPDLVIGAGVGQQVFGGGRGIGVQRGVGLRQQRVGRDLDVAVDIAAGGQGVDERGVDRLHGRLQFALDHAVELEGLARGDPQGVIAIAGGDGVQLQPLLGGDHAAGRTRTDHELVGRLQLLATAHVAHVAVVLLVAAVILDQRLVVLAQRPGHRVGQALQQAATQAAAVGFDVFDGMGHGARNEWRGTRNECWVGRNECGGTRNE